MLKLWRSPKSNTHYLLWVALIVGALVLFDLGSFLLAEGFWFAEVNYQQVFITRIQTQGLLGLVTFGLSLGFLGINLAWAHRAERSEPFENSYPFQMRFSRLLPIVIALSLLIGVMLVYHGQIAFSHWRPNLTLYSPSTPIPVKFRPESIWQIASQFGYQVWPLVIVLALAIAIILYPQLLLSAIALLMSLSFGLVMSEHWSKVLPFFYDTPFNEAEPLFSRDISFYIFRLPVWELVDYWVVGLFTLTLASVSLIYFLANNSLSNGKFLGFSLRQQRHLYGLSGCFMLAVALSYWLNRYELLYSPEGVAYGASYTDVVARLPVYTGLSILAVLLALYLFWKTIARSKRTQASRQPSPPPSSKISQQRSGVLSGLTTQALSVAPSPAPPQRRSPSGPRILFYSLVGYFLLATLAGWLVPFVIQRLVVQPNELNRESLYIERTIALTREAFDLEAIESETFDPQYDLTLEDLEENELTIENIRLWDRRPLLQTNRQLERIRLYYEFPDADIDRYTLPTADGGTEQQQVLIAARELDYSAVPTGAQTWVNQHLIYTHGYGFTLSPVNTAAEGGLPAYFIRGIEHVPSSPRIRDSIPVGQPRLYYGELTNTYVMTDTRLRELDFPSGDENVYNVYDGRGGVNIGPFWRRLLYAKHLRDWQMLFTEDFNPQTKLLFRRNIKSRVQAIAPFLRFDSDPYLVTAEAYDEDGEHYLYWIIDAYTTSDRYPYSDPIRNDFNYIRNSVKVVIDAYNGTVRFYVADEQDPIINTWSRIFPNMFQSFTAMPVSLRSHLRYPLDFYQVQSDELMTYHMTDIQVFYNREDQWRAPTEIYADEPQLVEPYYLIMRLPGEESEEFILFRPFTPTQRNNLIAWLSARSDDVRVTPDGRLRYGRMLLYRFPKQELVFGPEQIEARINQDPIISQQISLWNRRGSRAIQGNLLVIPIEQSLLYIEPLYLEAEQTGLPILARVIVAYQNRIVMAETLEQALAAVFEPAPDTPAIVRPVPLEEDGLDPGFPDLPPAEGAP